MIVKGQKIDGRYQIVRNIGEGGMANVYLAYDTILEREVAVKILRGDLATDEKFVKRFQREAKAASSLNHPNIVEMYDVGEDDGNYFIVMEYIDGKTLKSLIKKRGALSLPEIIDIMLQLTSAIACAHDSYIIHRDIKPQNVLILEDGRVKITDFGIAIALNSAELTQTNSVMGSVHYLPPEQANGNGATIKSDIYSLGILMYELLTGKLPFKGENAVEIALKQMKEQIPSVCEQNAIIPQSVENIVLKACAKNPKNRYDSVAEMHKDLKEALMEDKKNCQRVVYEYPENDLEETKNLPNLAEITEMTAKVAEKETELEELIEDKKDNKRIKWTLIIVSIICTFIALSIAVAALILVNKSKNKSITLPIISTMTEAEAKKELQKKGIDVIIEEESSDTVLEGNVIGYKNKTEGVTKVKKGSTVTIIVSSGEAGVLVEDYTGKKVDVVEIELQNKGVKVVKTQKKIDEENYEDEDGKKKEVFEGMIVGQSVKEGERVLEGNAIELYYAVLIATYPDFSDPEEDYDKDKAQTFCDDNKITCEFEEVETEDYPAGTIFYQNREKGVEVKEGVTLRLKVAVAIPKYTVSFDPNGGGTGSSSITAQTVKKGELALKPTTKPTRTNYNFTGWCTDQNGNYEFDFGTPISSNMILYACWEEI